MTHALATKYCDLGFAIFGTDRQSHGWTHLFQPNDYIRALHSGLCNYLMKHLNKIVAITLKETLEIYLAGLKLF